MTNLNVAFLTAFAFCTGYAVASLAPREARAGYSSIDAGVTRMADALDRIEKRLGQPQK